MKKQKDKNKRFLHAIDYLKTHHGIQYKTVYNRLEMGRGRWDAIKKDVSNVHDFEINKLLEMYPDTETFFEEKYIFDEPTSPAKVDLTEKYITMMEENLEAQKAKVEILKTQISCEEALAEMKQLLEKVVKMLEQKTD